MAVDGVLLERKRMGGGLHLRACFGDARKRQLQVKTRERTHPVAAAFVLATPAAGNTHGGVMVGALHPTVPQKAANSTAAAAAAATSASPPQPSTAAAVAAVAVVSDGSSHPS